eukprot:SAG31_NODE_685_length_12832_cov_28.355376_4_plen_190_part_00
MLLLLAPALASAALGAGAPPAPVFGTFFHPNLSDRAVYHWTFSADSAEHRCSQLLFGDVDADGRDDLLRVGCGANRDVWTVSLSDGVSGWDGARPAWSDGAGPGAQRFAADLDNDGDIDLATHDANASRWAYALSDGRGGFGSGSNAAQVCDAGHAYASTGALWCLGKGCYFLVLVPTIREIREFYREM